MDKEREKALNEDYLRCCAFMVTPYAMNIPPELLAGVVALNPSLAFVPFTLWVKRLGAEKSPEELIQESNEEAAAIAQSHSSVIPDIKVENK